MFWDEYKRVEKGLLVSLQEFISNTELRNEVINGLLKLLEIIKYEVYKVTNKENLKEGLLLLLSRGIINSNLYQELIDIINLIEKIHEVDYEIIYSMLVRILENFEALHNILK
jgi:hypothetical protein